MSANAHKQATDHVNDMDHSMYYEIALQGEEVEDPFVGDLPPLPALPSGQDSEDLLQ